MPASPHFGPTSSPALESVIRGVIQKEGPISFARFMEMSLYHSEHGYYSSGRCVIGRGGDYFTNVSVGPLFGQLMAAQFAEIWEKLDRPNDFTIVEQGAHHGEFATDVLAALRERWPELFRRLCYRIIEPFPILRRRQQAALISFADKMEWVASVEEMEAFSGVHFSNELLDAFPVHLLVATNGEWRERLANVTSSGFTLIEQALTDTRLRARLAKIPPLPNERYETEINLVALDWVSALAPKLLRGVILAVDYGFARDEFYSSARTPGTLQGRAAHHLLSSPLIKVGMSDLTAHVEWTSLGERAEECGLTIAGFTDQHHFLTGLLAGDSALARFAAAPSSRALQTLLHPEFLGTRFQYLALTKSLASPPPLGGYKFARDPRVILRLP